MTTVLLLSAINVLLVTYIAQVVSDDQVTDKLFSELGVHLEDVEQIVAMNLMQITVRHRAHVTTRLTNSYLFADVFTEHVVFACFATTSPHQYPISNKCTYNTIMH